MDLRKGPNYYFEHTEHTRKSVISGTQSQEVNLNESFKHPVGKTPIHYHPDYVANYNNANNYYRQQDDATKNLYNVNFVGPKATAEDLFVKPKPTNSELLANLLGGGINGKDPEPSYYREIKESRGGQSSLSAMSSMRGESSSMR